MKKKMQKHGWTHLFKKIDQIVKILYIDPSDQYVFSPKYNKAGLHQGGVLGPLVLDWFKTNKLNLNTCKTKLM